MKSPPKKTCILEPMPTSSVIAWIEVLPPVLTKITNFSFESGMFADNWKCTLFNPLSKIPGLDLVLFRLKNWIVTTLQGLISIGYSYLSPSPAVSGARQLYWTCYLFENKRKETLPFNDQTPEFWEEHFFPRFVFSQKFSAVCVLFSPSF